MHFIVILAFVLFAMPITGSGWAEGSNVLLEPGRVCKKNFKKNSKLADICSNETSIMYEITRGINMSFTECNNQFRNRRWNCTTVRRSIRKILVKDTRETAYINAITAAGITYQVTEACSRGQLLECPCDNKNHPKNMPMYNSNNNNNNNKITNAIKPSLELNPNINLNINQVISISNDNNNSQNNNKKLINNNNNNKRNKKKDKMGGNNKKKKKKIKNAENEYNLIPPKGDWQWGGCGDNVDFGYRKSREFLDSRHRKKSDIKTLLRLHNNNAGRLAVKRLMKLQCQCHGLSGSCTMQTCWLKLPKFADVGLALKDRFDGAVKVIAKNNGKSFMQEDPTTKSPERYDLVYTDDSPDFCQPNVKTGSLGTYGRECNATSQGVDGCDLLCCNRGSDRKIIREKVNCNCEFRWCCEVTCDICPIKKEINTCR